MATAWTPIEERLRTFEAEHGATAVSIKVRVGDGCYHRECSPHAYALIDDLVIRRAPTEVEVIEHENGPEILTIVAASLTIADIVIRSVWTIVKARRDGIERGDPPDAPVEIAARTFDARGTLREEVVLRIGHHDPMVSRTRLKAGLNNAVERIRSEVENAE